MFSSLAVKTVVCNSMKWEAGKEGTVSLTAVMSLMHQKLHFCGDEAGWRTWAFGKIKKQSPQFSSTFFPDLWAVLCYREEYLPNLPCNIPLHSFLWSYMQGKTLRGEILSKSFKVLSAAWILLWVGLGISCISPVLVTAHVFWKQLNLWAVNGNEELEPSCETSLWKQATPEIGEEAQ